MASPRGFWARKMPESGIFFPSTSDQKPSILLLLRGLELLTILDAAIGEHQDFGFFVGHFLAGLGPNDEGLRAIGQIECALKLQGFDAALLTGVCRQRGFQ